MGSSEFSDSKKGTVHVSEDFDISMSKISFYNPLRFGITAGIKFNFNEIGLSFSDDGSSVVSRVYVSNYQPNNNIISPSVVINKTSTFAKSFQLSYGRYLKRYPNLKFFGGINCFFRGGSKESNQLSEFGTSGYIDNINNYFELYTSSFTLEIKKSFGLQFGFGYKLNSNSKYLFDVLLNFKYNPSSLYYNKIRMVTNIGTTDEKTYVFIHYPTNSSINFTFSRRFKYALKK